MEFFSCKRQELCEIFFSSNFKSIDKKFEDIETFLIEKTNCSEGHVSDLKKELIRFKFDLKSKWKKSHSTRAVFDKKESNWLHQKVEFKMYSLPPGRPQTSFELLSKRRKRERVADLRDTSAEELVFAAQMNFRAAGDKKTAESLEKTVSPPNTSKSSTAMLTPGQALSMLIEAKLSRDQYDTIRKYVTDDVLPSYKVVQKEKTKCYPENLTVNELTAEVPMQNLLNHTVERISASQKDVFNNASCNELTLYSKVGFDGSSGHSEYHQRFSNTTDADDKFVFITCLVPLNLSSTLNVFWKNPCPSSPRYCRPIKITFEKETDSLINRENESILLQLNELEPTKIIIENREYIVKHQLILSMVDGKLCNSLSGVRSAQRCYLCQATSKDFNNIEKIVSLPISHQFLSFGISVLHAWIRMFECLLHVAYKLPVKEWRKSKGTEDCVAENKSRIQEAFEKELGLKIDRPKPGYGNTNTGNVARRFFKNYIKSSEITGIDVNLITKFHIILQCLSSGFNIDVPKFKMYCLETAKLFVLLYPWYYMSTSVHKILIHGHEIVSQSVLPIGELSEEALEARNKDFKMFREHFSRKTSRQDTLTDIMNRMLISSDPFITNQRVRKPSKKIPFDSEAIEMFIQPDLNNQPQTEIIDYFSDSE